MKGITLRMVPDGLEVLNMFVHVVIRFARLPYAFPPPLPSLTSWYPYVRSPLSVGPRVGERVGLPDGFEVVGILLGVLDGVSEGLDSVGTLDGDLDGTSEGRLVDGDVVGPHVPPLHAHMIARGVEHLAAYHRREERPIVPLLHGAADCQSWQLMRPTPWAFRPDQNGGKYELKGTAATPAHDDATCVTPT